MAKIHDDEPHGDINIGVRTGEAQPKLRRDQELACATGAVTGSGPTGMTNAVPVKRFHSEGRPKNSYASQSFAGGCAMLGHNHLAVDLTDAQAHAARNSYIDHALSHGVPRAMHLSASLNKNMHGVPSNGIQRIPVGRTGQTMLSSTPSNGQGRYLSGPESSIRQPAAGSVSNPSSDGYGRLNLGHSVNFDGGPIGVGERAEDTLASIRSSNHEQRGQDAFGGRVSSKIRNIRYS